MKSRMVPGNDVDSLMTKTGCETFSAMVLHADSINPKSGFLSESNGVGTAMTTISASEISAP